MDARKIGCGGLQSIDIACQHQALYSEISTSPKEARMRRLWEFTSRFVLVILVLSLVGACAASTSTPTPAAPAATTKDSSSQGKSKAEDNAEIARLARQEGKLVVWGGTDPQGFMDKMIQIFKERHGVEVQYVALRAGDIMAKLPAEVAAGKVTGDLIGPTATSVNRQMALDGYTVPFVPSAASEPIKWILNPMYDADVPQLQGKAIATVVRMSPKGLGYNSKIVPPNLVPKNYQVLLDPFYKGKLVMVDPRLAAGAPIVYRLRKWHGTAFEDKLWEQKPIFENSAAIIARMVATGEVAAAVEMGPREFIDFKDTPLKFLYPEEGTYVSINGMSIIKGAPHPNAAKLYFNFLLSEEGQDIGAKLAGWSPVRPGVKAEYPEADLAGHKLYVSDWEEDMTGKAALADEYKKKWGAQ